MALGILRAETNDMLHSKTCTDVAKRGKIAPPMFVLLFLSIQEPVAASTIQCTSHNTQHLYEKVQESLWNTNIYPVSNINDTLTITLGFTIAGILGVNEKEQSLTIFILRTLDWNVDFVSWNATECGTSKISYPKSELWMPDIFISECMEKDKGPDEPYIYISSTGGIHVDEPKRIVSLCDLDIYRFPFDVQNCSLTFASYLHEDNDIQLTSKTEEFIMTTSNTFIQTDGEWKLIKVTPIITSMNISERNYSAVIYYCDVLEQVFFTNVRLMEQVLFMSYTYIMPFSIPKDSLQSTQCSVLLHPVNTWISMKRVPTLYVVNLLIPSGFLITLDLFSFFLPPENVDRSAFKMTLILGYTVFLLIMNDLLPDTSQTTPLINVYFSICLALMVVSLLETIFIVNLRVSSASYPKVPHWLHILVLRFLARLVFITPKPTPSVIQTLDRASSSAKVALKPDVTGDSDRMEAADVEELRKLRKNVMEIRMRLEEYLRPNPSTEDWQQIATVIDRFLFFVYVIFISLSIIIIIILWANQ